MDGKSHLGALTLGMLTGFSVMMSMPALMVNLSVVLPARASRIVNLAVGTLFTAIMLQLVPQLLLDPQAYFCLYYAALEICLSLTIVLTAWRLPKGKG